MSEELSPTAKQKALFQFIFGEQEGYLCIATIDRSEAKKKLVNTRFFLYPHRIDDAILYVEKHKLQNDVYFCPHLLDSEVRRKEHALECGVLWSDVDDCPVEDLLVEPTIVIQSSDNRTQALWKLSKPIEPEQAEELNRRIAYYHFDDGMDKGGWDLTQLLRVPYTLNHKYIPPQEVLISKAVSGNVYNPEDFSNRYPELDPRARNKDIPYPENLPDTDPEEILKAYQNQVSPRALTLFEEEPQPKTWSDRLWELEVSLIEGGVPLDEVFIVARESACNKYARDNRPDAELWTEIVKAYRYVELKHAPVAPSNRPSAAVSPIVRFSPLLKDSERNIESTLIEEYIEWAKTTGDASYQYHQAAAFIVLSTLLAGRLTLPTSFATIRPNLWFMILGDTTLTRKSTAMDLGVDLLTELAPSSLMATDGSIEGMLTQLSSRPGRPSLFLRDEFSGLLEMMRSRDYYAGMLEALTKLYDGRFQKRVLKKEEIVIKDPIFNIFAGGIKERILDLFQESHITSGFIPRFVFIIGETDLTRMKPVGPPTTTGVAARKAFAKKLSDINEYYKNAGVEVGDGRIKTPKIWEVELSPDAWRRYNMFNDRMRSEAIESERDDLLTPCMERLCTTALKISTLIAAVRYNKPETLVVQEQDILHAFYYVEQWREYTLEVVEGAGTGPQERLVMRVFDYITSQGSAKRPDIMTKFRFHGRKGDEVLGTLEDRGLIFRSKSGKSFVYRSIDE